MHVTLNCILLLMKFTCCCLLWMWFQKYGQLQDTQSFNSSHDLLLTKAIEFKSVCTSLNLWKHVTLIAYFFLMKFTCCCLLWKFVQWFQKYGHSQWHSQTFVYMYTRACALPPIPQALHHHQLSKSYVIL